MVTQVVNLIDTLYEASLDPSAFDTFVSELSQVTESAVAAFHSSDSEILSQGFISSYGTSLDELSKYSQVAPLHKEFFRHLPVTPSTGTIAYTEDVLPGGQLYTKDIYNKFLKPQGLEQANCMYIELSEKRTLSATFIREQSQGVYSNGQKEVFKTLMPHLQRTFRLRAQTNNLKIHQSQAWEMLEMLPYGVIVFSNQYKLLHINKTAENIILHKDGLSLVNSHLRAASTAESKNLAHWLKECISSTRHSKKPISGSDMLITRPSGKRPYSLMINPVSPVAGCEGCIYPAAIVVIQDFDTLTETPVQRMKSLYNLTPTESKVAHQIVLGHSIEFCAEKLGHSVATSRNLLKRVFAKTETGRQNELVSLMLRSPLNLVQQEADNQKKS